MSAAEGAHHDGGGERLDGRVALVTGAASGIGAATATLLARHGARIAAVDQDADALNRLRATIEQISDPGSPALTLPADVSDATQVRQAVETTAERWGRLDIVFANAGINGVWAPIDQIAPEEWDRTLAVNLRGTFLTLNSAAPHLKRQGGAVVIGSSINGTRVFSNTGATAYACSKAAQMAMAKMLALELARHRVRVNVICPGAVDTPIHQATEKRDLEQVSQPVQYPRGEIPLTGGDQATPQQVARLVLFLVSDAADHISGAEIFIDGTQSLLQG